MEIHQIIQMLTELMEQTPEPHSKAIREAIKHLSKAARKQQPKYPPLQEQIYQPCIDLYYTWHEAAVGLAPRMNAREGAAMKKIISYLRENSKTKDDAGALAAWEFILRHWPHLSQFLQRQTTLVQIEKNLTEIIATIKQYATRQDRNNTSASIAARIARRRHPGDQ